MESYELFSKRDKVTDYDVFQYDYLPDKLRNQIYFIWKDALQIEQAAYTDGNPGRAFEKIHDKICREHGFIELVEASHYQTPSQMCEWLLRCSDADENEVLLDLIEVSMREIDEFQRYHGDFRMSKAKAVEELNLRFRENGVGYEFTDNILIRKDSDILHKEVTKPALYLLHEQRFDGALQEYLKAHEHYRKGDYKDAIVNAGKAFESTMKTIGTLESLGLTGRENASNLINLLISNRVIPAYLENSLMGLATVRNNLGGHGQGATPVVVPEYLVNYALHVCGSNIVMLIEAYKEYSK